MLETPHVVALHLQAALMDLESVNLGFVPDLSTAPSIAGWSFDGIGLVGLVAGHPIHGPGSMRPMRTSFILWAAPDLSIARTRTRWYTLGMPAPGAGIPLRLLDLGGRIDWIRDQLEAWAATGTGYVHDGDDRPWETRH